MLKKLISGVLAAAAVSVLSAPVLASSVAVSDSSTNIGTTDNLYTVNNYKTVLVVNYGADLSNLEADNIYFIDQAVGEAQAFVNMGLKRNSNNKITEGNYTMYLVDGSGTRTERTIQVSDSIPVESTENFTMITREGGQNPVKELNNTYYVDQGWEYTFTPDEGKTVSSIGITISCTPHEEGAQTISYTVPASKLPDISQGTMKLGIQINDIPCDSNGNLAADFTVSFTAAQVSASESN